MFPTAVEDKSCVSVRTDDAVVIDILEKVDDAPRFNPIPDPILVAMDAATPEELIEALPKELADAAAEVEAAAGAWLDPVEPRVSKMDCISERFMPFRFIKACRSAA
jgi:hypothetical protein